MNPIDKLYRKIDQADLWDGRTILKRNDHLKVGGTVDTNVYYIESGSLKVSIFDDEDEHIIRFGYQDNFIVALDSFITEQSSDFFMQAIKKTEVRVIHKANYLNFIRSDPENKAIWDMIMEQLVLQQLEREKDLLTSSPKKRYERVLKRSPQLFQEVPNRHIASYLRMTPETLSRLKNP